ncbi:MAG: hypothetical protein J6X81_05825 [Muribaculaceae bacterium]|nr:hypothetical protein [Muribaculaceae bacterium]
MKRLIIFISGLLLLTGLVYGQERIVCDETCDIGAETKSAATKGDAGFAVVSPVGRGTVEPIDQAPRLNTLSGKTIAVVGVSFMSRVTHPEIKRLIEKNYPDAHVLLLDEVGTAGPYPAPGITRRAQEEFQKRLRDLHVDAVISGNGGCGLCTPKETGSCIAAEYMGIPSVIITAPSFTTQARYTALNNGVPVLRIAEYPSAFALDDEATLIRNTREILWPQIVDALTKPISAEERNQGLAANHGDLRDDVFFGTIDEVNDYFKEMNWSDGLPIVPPTFEKVNDMMRFSSYRWNETVATLPIAHRNTTAWHVAVNGVMAGCKPEYMPILIALTKALGGPEFRRTLASTHAWIPFCWINGPIARQLGIDCGQGEINEAANMAIGRFMNLALMNLCGYYVKQDRMGTFGYPMSWCMAEDETAYKRVGWQPYHVREGYNINDNTVTAASTLLWGNNMAPSTTDAEKIMQLLAWDISERCQFALGSGRQFTFRTILMTEPVAKTLATVYRSTSDLEQKLINASRRPLKERVFANYYANPGGAKDGGEHNIRQYTGHLRRTEDAKDTRTPQWYDTPEAYIETIPTMQQGMTQFLITGDNSRNKLQTMPGGGYSTIKIELPANWNTLMGELGYKPLSHFHLNP